MDNQDESLYAADIAEVQRQLAEKNNDPNLVILECHCLDLNFLEGKPAKTSEEHKGTCKKCSVYIDFHNRYPNGTPKH